MNRRTLFTRLLAAIGLSKAAPLLASSGEFGQLMNTAFVDAPPKVCPYVAPLPYISILDDKGELVLGGPLKLMPDGLYGFEVTVQRSSRLESFECTLGGELITKDKLTYPRVVNAADKVCIRFAHIPKPGDKVFI